ncbi:DUF424 family protein [Candidatus Woesearchaeota archaeon]|nr:DUF424 family protein [Candidatus Woesearchaeota archaeon]
MLTVSEKEGPHGSLIIVTDSDLLGKRFEEKRRQLDLTKDFYQGEEMNKPEAQRRMEKAQHLHLTGKEAVALGVEMDLVDSKQILYVQNVPHAEVVR